MYDDNYNKWYMHRIKTVINNSRIALLKIAHIEYYGSTIITFYVIGEMGDGRDLGHGRLGTWETWTTPSFLFNY